MQKNKAIPIAFAVITVATLSVTTSSLWAAELNTQLPEEQGDQFLVPINIDMPAQALGAALRQFAIQTNLSLTVDSELILDKKAGALKGRMSRKDALNRLLQGSGLQGKIEGTKVLIQKQQNKAEDKSILLDPINVRAKRFYEVGPLPGLGLTKEQIPGNVQSITAKEIKDSHSLSITDLMNKKLQSVTVNDYQGNPFQMDVQYRGFTAGPQIGTPQGLSVFFDGIRVNEPFGDVVNWDMIPMNAISSLDVFPGSNPIFGLNTLGGAFTLKTKDGFNNAGVDAEVLYGSFNRKQLQVEGGWNNGTIGLFAAGNFFLEDGWRENSPSKVNQLFTKASFRGDKLDLNLSTLWVGTDLVGNGLIPKQMYEQDRNGVFTSPDTTKNRLAQFQLSSSYFVNDNFTITGQIYRRNSKRHQTGGDAYTGGFPNTQEALRRLNPGEEVTCLYNSTNKYGIADYYLINLPQGDFIQNEFVNNLLNTGVADFSLANGVAGVDAPVSQSFNADLPDYYAQHAIFRFNYDKNFAGSVFFDSLGEGVTDPRYQSGPDDPLTGSPSYIFESLNFNNTRGSDLLNNFFTGFSSTYFSTPPAISGDLSNKQVLLTLGATNGDICGGRDLTLTYEPIDGRGAGKPGIVEGTPVSVITNTDINQVTDGASLQLNWNLEHHKFMVGVSIDAPSASYTSSQQLGLFDDERDAFLAPDLIRPGYAASVGPISFNNFKGKASTKSIYASETWSPIESLHINGALRYNETHVKNTLASRSRGTFGDLGLAYIRNYPDDYNVIINGVRPPTGYKTPDARKLFPAETEKFSFFSLNPSFGMTWQAKENLNIYGNVAQGTRVPSVIELGCALDTTPVGKVRDQKTGNLVDLPKGIAENRVCSLPSTLSGDPYLPQIKATSYDIGLRGFIGQDMQWNIGAYQTDLKDDIYLVAAGGSNSFFQTVGKTRRRGLEAGVSGKKNKWGFGLNYSLTDATFQDTFDMVSDHNSSATPYTLGLDGEAYRSITVEPGDRIPGVSLHNLNATLSYDVTDKWSLGFNAVAHSESFVRGNENNEHKKGVIAPVADGLAFRPTTNSGKTPGYAVVNFQSSYKFNSEWMATVQVTNLFDKEYFSGGRLGVNPFSPSINGAIGPGGYNHNSADWLSTNFLAPGAPRGVWFSLNWQFDPNKLQ